MYQVKTLENTSREEIFRVFAESFANYFVTIDFNPEVHFQRWENSRVDLSLSAGAFKDEVLCGFILISSLDRELFNLATGVLPKHRQQGLTTRMLEKVLDNGRRKQMQHLSLEVIKENTPAIRAYERAGLSKGRTLLSYKGHVFLPVTRVTGLRYEVCSFSKKEEYLLLQKYPPSFEHSWPILGRKSELLEVHELWMDKELLAYCIFNPSEMNLVCLEGKNSRLIALLLAEMKLSGAHVGIINVDGRNLEVIEALKISGLQDYIAQFEMGVDL